MNEQAAEEQEESRSGSVYIYIYIYQIFVLKQLVEKNREKSNELYVAFLDLEKAYDTVRRDELWKEMHECGVDGYLIRSMSSLYDGSRA